MVSWWDLHLVIFFGNQEHLLDGYCVEYMLGVVLGAIIEISVGKPDSDKVAFWIGRIIGTVLNTELCNCEGFPLYWALIPKRVCALRGLCMPTWDWTEMVSHYWCPCCVWLFSRCIVFGNQTIFFLIWLSFILVPWPLCFNNNNTPLYNITCMWIVPPKIGQTDVLINHSPHPISQSMQYSLNLGLLIRLWKYYFYHKIRTRAEWWLCWCLKLLKAYTQR